VEYWYRVQLATQHYVYRDKAGEKIFEVDAVDVIAAELSFITEFGLDMVRLTTVEIEPCPTKN
jgi:hypothetical protein